MKRILITTIGFTVLSFLGYLAGALTSVWGKG